MRSSRREDIVTRWDALHNAISDVLELSYDALTTPECLAFLERHELENRRLPHLGHALVNQVARQSDQTELGGTLAHALANRLRISRGEAGRRIREAEDLGPRQSMTGEPLPPRLEATATLQRDGHLGTEHVAVIRRFCARLPDFVDPETRQTAEAQLARLGAVHRPDELAKLAGKLLDCFNPDGDFSDVDRARLRGITIGKQGDDGMSPISGYLTPEARATVDAVFAKLAVPIEGDSRSAAQRHHDALAEAGRLLLASGKLGQHNGLPATIIVTTTLRELESGCGRGLTGGGTLLPMSDVIRLASHAHHYLAIFDNGRALALYHTKRLASPAQRIVLYAKDRGCTAPSCDVPAYFTEVHHVEPWAKTHTTDVNDLTLACRPHHSITEQGWTTRKNEHGDTEWIPPPHLDYAQPRVNNFHYPETLLREDGDDP